MKARSWFSGLVVFSLLCMGSAAFVAKGQEDPTAAKNANIEKRAPAENATRSKGGDAWFAAPMDWPHWRGPELNGMSRETGLVESWDPDGGEGSNLLWKREDLGGRSTPIVMNGKLYTIVRDQPGTVREGEKVVCLDAATGETLWENRFNVFLSDVPDTRVGWSSVVGDPSTGDVYALGVSDYFQKIDGETGETKWDYSLSESYGFLNTYGGRTNFPVVSGNLVIVSGVVIGWGDMAKPGHRFVAFDTRDEAKGAPIWFEGTRPLPYDTTYSAAINTVIEGQPALVFGSGDGAFHAFQTQTGKSIWKYQASKRGINLTPLVIDDGKTVIGGHNEENIDSREMGALFAIDATGKGDITRTGTKWKHPQWLVGRSTPLAIDGRIYAIENNANLRVIDEKTGKLLSQKKLGTVQASSPLYADGKIYTCTANGRWYILKPDGDDVEVVHRMRLDRDESHGSPIVSHGRLYIPTANALYCVGEKGRKPQATPRPAPPEPKPAEADSEPAHVQVVPVEVLLKPTQKQPLQVRLYNANGQFIGLAENPEFTLEGDGTIGDDGIYIPPAHPESSAEKYPPAAWRDRHHAVTVNVKVGELTGTARIRVIPPLPWKFDFSEGEIPVTWGGIRYRHVPIDFDLLRQLEQQDPRTAKLYIYLTSSFTNSGRDKLVFDDTTPAQVWTDLLRFLELIEQVRTVEDAKQELGPALETLAEEEFLASIAWEKLGDGGIRLTIERGSRKLDGNPVAMKITTIPKGTRSQGWMGPTDLHDYTIQADVFTPRRFIVVGTGDDRREVVKLPDIGIIGQRYTLDMMGASRQLQIRTWPPQLRMAKTIPFEWKPETWYTMKLRASVEDGKAVLRGKVWERDQDEPADWTITAEDPIPNTHGAPGLYGNAKEAEILYDDIRVTPNSPLSPAE